MGLTSDHHTINNPSDAIRIRQDIKDGEQEVFNCQLKQSSPKLTTFQVTNVKDKNSFANSKFKSMGSAKSRNKPPEIVINSISKLGSEKVIPIDSKIDISGVDCGCNSLHSNIHSLSHGMSNRGFVDDNNQANSELEFSNRNREDSGDWININSVGIIRTLSGSNPNFLCPGPRDEYADILGERNRRKSEGDMRSASMRHTFVLANHRRRCLQFIRYRIMTRAEGNKMKENDFVEVMDDMELLGKLFCLFDYNHQSKLKQDEWIEFLKSRLNGEEKQIDFVEVVETAAYALHGDADLNFERFCAVFRSKNVLNKLYRLIDRNYDGVITLEQVMEFISQLSSMASSSSRLTPENVKWLETIFRQNVGEDDEITKEGFKKIIQTKNKFFTERMFEIFDTNSSGTISLQEFLQQMQFFMGDDPDYKIKFLFQCYDVDGDGLIQEPELEEVMTACMEENGMKFSFDQIRELTKALFEDADVEGRGTLTYEALKAQLEKHEGLLENLSISIERWLVPPKPKETKAGCLTKLKSWKPHQFSPKYLKNNYVYLIWLAAFIITNSALFLYRLCTWKLQSGGTASDYLVVARAAGQCLNFNCTFVVVMMLRQSLTFLRARGASSFLPIDQHIYFHILAGRAIFLFSVLHTVMHLINIQTSILTHPSHENDTYAEILFDPSTTKDFGLVRGFAFNSGVVIMVILTIMVICALPFVRRRGSFEVFYWTHLLYVVFLSLLIIHAPNFWKWFVVVGVVLLLEQAFRVYQWRGGHGRTTIRSGMLLPSKVTHLTINRPPNFEFHPGDYVFVRIPTIAKFEWHPFTISSAPEQSDVISLHIRGVGEWTNRLYDYFEKQTKLVTLEEDEAHTLLPQGGVAQFTTTSETQRTSLDHGHTFNAIPEGDESFDRPVQNVLAGRLPMKSVGDSFTTVGPESSAASGSIQNSINLESSTDFGTENSGMPSNKMLSNRHHRLASTTSMPDVSEGTELVPFKPSKPRPLGISRSYSVQSPDGEFNDNDKLGVYSRLDFRDPFQRFSTSKYLGNKPRVITFDQNSDGKDEEKLLEEGYANLPSNGDARKPSVFSSFQVTGSTDKEMSAQKLSLEIYVDGPYGAPSSHIFRAEHAVLVATGIGVTPFASILQSIMLRYRATRQTCPRCSHSWCPNISQSVFNLKKVDFLWINREQRSFEWFVHLLSQLEIEQAEIGGAMERFLDMHMYITSALQRTDMKAVGLQLALDLLHKKEKRDLITGLKTRTNAGRPNWNKLFAQLKDQNKGKITVFYCGPPQLARTLKMKCDELGFTFRKELF